MHERSFDEILADVSRSFNHPQEICDAPHFTREQKVKLLTQWEQDLRLMMIASEENMPSEQPGRTAELLQAVREALTELGAASSLELAGAAKMGGTSETAHKSS